MTKYYIVKKCENNSSCKKVSFQNTKKLCTARPFQVGRLQRISFKSCICSYHIKEGDISQGGKNAGFNPIKAGGLNLCIEKALVNRYRV